MALTFSERGAELRLAQDMLAGRITAAQFKAGYGALTKATRGARAPGASVPGVSEADLGYPASDPSVRPIIRRPPTLPTPGRTLTPQAPSARLETLKTRQTAIRKRISANASKMRQMSTYGGM